MTKFLSTAKPRVFRMLCAHDVDVRTVGFAVSFRSCRAIQGGFLLLAMLCFYLVSDTWSLTSLSRSTLTSLAIPGTIPVDLLIWVSPDQQVWARSYAPSGGL